MKIKSVLKITFLMAIALFVATTAAHAQPEGSIIEKSWFKFLCEEGGGTYYDTNNGGYECYYPDGTIVFCDPGTGCDVLGLVIPEEDLPEAHDWMSVQLKLPPPNPPSPGLSTGVLSAAIATFSVLVLLLGISLNGRLAQLSAKLLLGAGLAVGLAGVLLISPIGDVSSSDALAEGGKMTKEELGEICQENGGAYHSLSDGKYACSIGNGLWLSCAVSGDCVITESDEGQIVNSPGEADAEESVVEAQPTPTFTSTVQAGPPRGTITDQTLCWVGPGSVYDVVSTIEEGVEVELVGPGEGGGYIVVVNPRYVELNCWVDEDDISLPQGISGLPSIQIPPPPTPTSTPTYTPTSVPPKAPTPTPTPTQTQIP